jgi:anti-sigma regulatory factor (Ser/Thr protein kinase)
VIATALRHDAIVYETDERFVDQVASFVRAGLEEDASTVAVLRPEMWELLREALGSASRSVTLMADPDEWYTRPVVAIGGYEGTLRDYMNTGSQSVRVVAELPGCTTQREWDTWTSYEAILNRAFVDYPAWILCAYDQRILPERVVESAWRTHEQVLTDGWSQNGHYHPPEHVVTSLAAPDEPGLDLVRLPAPEDPRAFRELLVREMAAAGVPGDRARDMLVAANEIVANAWMHGGGPRAIRAGPMGDSFVCEVSDPGSGLTDPLAGYLPPRSHTGGAGLWIARQFTRRLDLVSSAGGLIVRLWI